MAGGMIGKFDGGGGQGYTKSRAEVNDHGVPQVAAIVYLQLMAVAHGHALHDVRQTRFGDLVKNLAALAFAT